MKNRKTLSAKISAATREWTRDILLEKLERQNVPASRINTVKDAFNDPQIIARKMLTYLTNADGETAIPSVRTPLQFSDAQLNLKKPSPQHGKDKAEWL